ncbi:hypothetical protein V7S43_001824 [Phytophthora oleae]
MKLLPVNDSYVNRTQKEVLQVLEASYQTNDPPMYTGMDLWAVAARPPSNGVNFSATVASETDAESTSMRGRKRRRVHAVFGRVTSVSPISRQKDLASSHFFVEIECHRSCGSSTQSVANVMFTGVDSMRWNLFIRPGKIILLTDLVKVLSRECDMFLLQVTHGKQRKDSGTEALETLVLLWDVPTPPQEDTTQWINDSMDSYSKIVSHCTGKLLDYEGQVCRILWDECIELEGPDKTRVVACLFHFPYTHELIRLRKGATAKVSGAHVLRWPTPVGGKLVLGLCPRSHFTIISYGDPSGFCITMGTRSRRGRAHKKWLSLGNFHCQSMVLSMWLLEVLELLDAKFFFGEEERTRLTVSGVSFSQTRRRATSYVAKKLNISLVKSNNQKALTLGALFLKCHSNKPSNCITVQLPQREKVLTYSRVLTIRELQQFGKSKLDEGRFDDIKASGGALRVSLSADDLNWCLLLGTIRGNIDSGGLEVYDRTGSIFLCLKSGERGVNLTDGRGVYLFRCFEFTIEDCNQVEDLQPKEILPLVYCINCSTDSVDYVAMSEDEDISFSPKEEETSEAQEEQEIVIMVTHVDALPCSSKLSAGFLPEYRVFHAIVCPVGKGLPNDPLTSMYTADILVNTQSTSWYLQKGGCYRMKAIESIKDAEGRPHSHYSVEDRVIETSMSYWEKYKVADSNTLCFESLNDFFLQHGKESANKPRLFRVFRVENSIRPIKLECDDLEVCEVHELCKKSGRDVSDILVDRPEANSWRVKPLVALSPIEATKKEILLMSTVKYFFQRSEDVSQVYNLLQHPLTSRSLQSVDNNMNDDDRPVTSTLHPYLHKSHLISVVGVIVKKEYYWRSNALQQTATAGVKRAREFPGSTEAPSRRLACVLYVRGLQHLDTVEIRVDSSRFGMLGALQLNRVVEFSRLQGFIARSSYKVYLNWSHFTAARLVSEGVYSPVICERELYGSMSTAFLNDLYDALCIDRMIYRYVVGVMHISYVVIKRKCGLCHQALELNKRRGVWKHADPQVESKYSRDCAWRWQHLAPSDSAFRTRTYMGTTVRCIIDDGSAQAELFLGNDVAWELLVCTEGQHRRFEDIVSNYVEELTYFSGRTANGYFATSKAEREQEYYQNELRAFVLNALPWLRRIVVFAHRFYKAKDKEGTSVLTFGKDIHLTTKTVPLPKLEAKRVDRLHVRNELQQRLVQLRQRMVHSSS